MEPNSSNRAEAERWLVIAEKLLTTRDLIGSKTFAIRARESDPRLESADRILAVADTLLAGEKRINNQPDWYAILQIAHQTQNSELVATEYRRLALLLNPIRNRLQFADEAFKLVSDAWSVLSNPSKKSIYDNELALATGSTRVQEPQPPQQQQQQQQNVRRSPRKYSSNVHVERNVTEEPITHDLNSSFWTACPYCYNMFEYPRVYVDCTIRCQNCRRAFHAGIVQSPPPSFEGKDSYFCCWGFFPLGGSVSNLEKNKGGVSNWAPFSAMFNCPSNVVQQNVSVAVPKPKKANVRKSSAPRVYVDDHDVFAEVSEPSEDSDDDWGSGSVRKKKKVKNVKGKGSAGKSVGRPPVEKGKNVKVGGGENLQGGSAVQEGITGVPNATNIETRKKPVASNTRKQTGRVAKDMGKLDLNVEFSNEVEEHAPAIREGNGPGHGPEEGIEGTGFFEGLDEFLNSLPILSIVGDDKVKATQ